LTCRCWIRFPDVPAIEKAKSLRQIPLPGEAKKAIRQYKKWQEWQKHLLGDKWQENNLVLASAWGRVIETSNSSSKLFKEILEKAGIPRSVKFHDLRHTHATLLLQQEANPKIVQERVGNSTIAMTLDS
jgi:integrase